MHIKFLRLKFGFYLTAALTAMLLMGVSICSSLAGGVVATNTEAALETALAGGGTVTFAFDGTLVVTSPKYVATNITLNGSGRSVVISGGNASQLFIVATNGELTLVDLTFSAGRSTTNGGAIFNRGKVYGYSCRFLENEARGANGANGINGANASGVAQGGNGTVGKSGGGVSGGAIHNEGILGLDGCVFSSNGAYGGNGGAGGQGGNAPWYPGNGADGGIGGTARGGAIFSTNELAITNCFFFNNSAVGGNGGNGGSTGSGYNSGDNADAAGGGGGTGGAVCAYLDSFIVGATFQGGTARGGNAGNHGTTEIGNPSRGVSGATGAGGGLCNFGTNVLLNCTFYQNDVHGGNGGNGSGGGIGVGGGDGGDGGVGRGGGLYSSSIERMTNCTFYSCGTYGGSAGQGGPPAGSSIAGSAGGAQGGSVARLGGTLTLKASIFAYPANGNNGYFNGGTTTDVGQNISSDGSMGLNTSVSKQNTDPRLNGLADNGGPTPTCSLQSNSPAINAATNGAPLVDQRGYYRAYAPDAGAYEYAGAAVNYTFIEINATKAQAGESGTNIGIFSIVRTGKANETNVVGLDISGTAVAGVDYTALATNIIFAPNVMQVDLVVTPLQNTPVEPAETVVAGLKPGTNYLLGLSTNAVVTLGQDGPAARSGYPSAERYLRGTGTNLDYYTMLVPLDALKGSQRVNFETNSPLVTLYHYSGAVGGSQNATNNRIVCNTPVASFGSGWGTALRPAQSYSIGLHIASLPYGTIYIDVYARTNLAYVGSTSIELPDGTDWIEFATNGFARTSSGYGLKTVLRTASDMFWGTSNAGYVLTHTADSVATNYYYLVSAGGFFGSEKVWINSSATGTYGPLYDLVFDERPGWRSLFVEQPQFNGQPLPPDLLNKTPEELLNYGAAVTNSVGLAPSTCTNLDQSPELRRHPVLDQFVADLNYDPIALANYVQNEIELTDAIAYRDDGQVQSESVNSGGVNRNALGTYLEGQGSPMEQCAFLIYLLRQAGYPAAYVFPPDGGLKLLDTRLSQLLRMQFKGAQDEQGHLYTTNRIIPVNYPWVAVYINGQWVHLFPWLKDTQVTEGLNLRDYLPDPYKETQLWVKDYVFGKTNIMAFATANDDTLGTIFPRWLDNQLKQNAPGISVADIGMNYVNRRHWYAQWSDFPRPTLVTNTCVAVESLSSSTLTNVSATLTNVFDTVYVEVLSLLNPGKVISTPVMRMADLHNRKFFLTHTNLGSGQVRASLILGPFNPSATNTVGTFSLSDTELTNKQVISMTLDGTDDNLRMRIRHRRQRAITWQTAVDWKNGFLELNSAREVAQERQLRKGDLAAICLNAGRVTPAMLRVHAQELWNMEQMLSTNSVATNQVSVDVYQGCLLYLMGMSYYERVSRFEKINRGLNKVQSLSSYAMGLAKLSPRRNFDGTLAGGSIDPVWPNVDMFFRNVTLAGNGSARLDSGWDGDLAVRNYLALSITDGSAQEHAILNTFFGQSSAVSTVKVLQLAQSKVSGGGSNVVELNYFNYQSAGNVSYQGKPLRYHDPGMWAAVENFFNQEAHSLFSVAWLSPGAQTTDSGSYSGMAALLLGPTDQAGLIGNNQYGAFANQLNPGTLSPAQLVNSSLSVDANNNFSWNTIAPTASQPQFSAEASRLYDLASQGDWLNNGWAYANPSQNLEGELAAWALNGAAGTYPGTFGLASDVGFMTPDFKEGNSIWSKIADPVNALSGEFYVDTLDLSLPGPMPLQVRRNYGSHDLSANQIGYGWKLNYMPYLSVAPSNNIIYAAEASGSVLAFSLVGTNLWAPTTALNPMLNNNTDQGIGSMANYFNSRLVKVSVSSTNFYYLTNSDGSLRIFQEMSFPLGNSPALDRLRPYLTSWFDARGNNYHFEYGLNAGQADYGQVRRIAGSSGNMVRFLYDPYGRVVEAYSADGRRVQYDYDVHGDLRKVTLPDAAELNYEYELKTWNTNGLTNVYSTHLITSEFKPEGRVLKNEYDGQRRVTNQWSTVGPDLRLVRNASFRYTNNFNLTNLTGTLSGTTTILDYTNNPTTYFYTNGLIRKIVDPLGGALVQDWYEANETNTPAYPRSLKTVTDKRGLVTSYFYDAQGNVTNTTVRGDLAGDGNTNAVMMSAAAYNSQNLPILTVDASGTTNVFFYTNNWLLARLEVWPGGASPAQATTNLYEYSSVTNATDGTVAYGLRVREIRAALSSEAATNEWIYSSRGYPTVQIRYSGTSDPAVVVSNLFNARGELVLRADSAGRSTFLGYDPRGSIQSREIFEAGQSIPLSWEYSYYNQNGELTWSDGPRYDPEDYIWRDYDGAGRKSQEIHWRSRGRADGSGVEAATGDDLYATSFYEYDAFNNLTKTIDPLGHYSLKRYDSLGRLTREEFYSVNGQLLATNGLLYNVAGDVTNTFNPLGGRMETQYTSTGKLRFQRNADGSTNAWRYYADGRLRREIKGNGAYWETTYDDASRKVTKIFYSAASVPLATNVTFFDRRGNTVQTVDAGGNVFTTTFDGLDRVKRSFGPSIESLSLSGMDPEGTNYVTNAVQQVSTYVYDASGKTLVVTNALGERTVTATDALGRTLSVEVYGSNSVSPLRVTRTAYTQNHHGTTVTNGTGANALVNASFTDNEGRMVLSIGYPAANVREYSLTTYDRAGNASSAAHLAATNTAVSLFSTTSNVFDGLHRILSHTDIDGALTYLRYDAAGNLTNRALPRNLTWSASYNNAGQMLNEQDSDGANATRNKTYTYYPAGDAWAGLPKTVTEGNGVIRTNAYDDWLRVASVTTTGPLDEQKMSCSWLYDPRGLLAEVDQDYRTPATGAATATEHLYNAYGQMISEQVFLDGNPLIPVWQAWNSAGRRSQADGMNFKYRADGLMTGVNASTFGYGDNGLMTGRTNGSRAITFDQRDGLGRLLQRTTRVNAGTVLTENWTWTGDDFPLTYVAARNDFTDTKRFTYDAATRRMLAETFHLTNNVSVTNSYTFDNNSVGGPGVLTKVTSTGNLSNQWSGGTDSFSRIATSTNTLVHRAADGLVNGAARLRAYVNGQATDVHYDPRTGSRWTANMALKPGATNTLVVYADHPSGGFTTNKSSTFTVSGGAYDKEDSQYDGAGNVTNRIWRKADGTVLRTQSLVWDGFGRLAKISERDASGNGFNLVSTFDGLGRQIETVETMVTNNVALTARPAPLVIVYHYDPQIEFEMIGVGMTQGAFHRQEWLAYGPDLSGSYGGMQGIGGLETVTSPPFSVFVPVINDGFGNVLGAVTNSVVKWNAARVSLYAPVENYAPPRLQLGVPLYESLAWRTRPVNAANLIQLGARPYDPLRKAFLAADPLGHESDMALNTAFKQNPGFYFDADGRFGKDMYQNGSPSSQNMRAVGDALSAYANATDNSFLGAGAEFASYFANMAANAGTPSTFVNQAASDYQAQGGGALGVMGAANRYNPTKPFFDVGSGIDMVDAHELSGVERTSAGLNAFGSSLLVGTSLARPTVPSGGLPPVISETGTASEMVTVSRWGRTGLQAGDWVMNGEVSRSTFLRSFKWDPNPSNIRVPFKDWATGENFVVPKESLSWPSGWEKFKGFFGQRIYDPDIK